MGHCNCQWNLLEIDVWLPVWVFYKHSNETGTQPDTTAMDVLYREIVN